MELLEHLLLATNTPTHRYTHRKQSVKLSHPFPNTFLIVRHLKTRVTLSSA